MVVWGAGRRGDGRRPITPSRPHVADSIDPSRTTLSDEPTAVESLHDLYRYFPTPVAQLVQRAFQRPDERARRMAWLLGEALRFVSLLAVQDALASGVYGADAARPADPLTKLRFPMVLGNWRNVLRAACPAGSGKGAAAVPPAGRFIPELAGWAAEHDSFLNVLLRGRNEWAHGPPPLDFRDAGGLELSEGLRGLFARLAFLRRFVLFGVTEEPGEYSQGFEGQALRGVNPDPQPAGLEADPDSPLRPRRGRLYLLDPDARRPWRSTRPSGGGR